MQQFFAVIEKAPGNYAAFLPDVPGCVSTGDTIEETLQNIREALEFHFEGMIEEGLPLPTPHSLQHHFNSGMLDEGEVSPEYLIATVLIPEQQMAA